MTTKINNIASAFDAMKPGIAKEYSEFVRRQWDRLVEKYGNGRALEALSGSWGQDGGMWRAVVRPVAGYDTPNPSVVRPGTPRVLDEDRLAKRAREYAEESVASFVAKLIAKLSDLDAVGILSWNTAAGTFTITGKLGDRRVHVEQSRVFKVSNKGTPFYQWPARIYVDGDFVSEKAFKALSK